MNEKEQFYAAQELTKRTKNTYYVNKKGHPPEYKFANDTSKTVVREFDVERNDPCPCASGVKFKKCCKTLPQLAQTFQQMKEAESKASE